MGPENFGEKKSGRSFFRDAGEADTRLPYGKSVQFSA
jgi:hypothetical protein